MKTSRMMTLAGTWTLLGAVLLVVAAGCGGGGNTTTPTPPVATLTGCAPGQGPTTGGTPITLTGTSFADPATVTVGGTSATGVVVVNDTTITANTPAGALGPPVDIAVTVPAGTATLTGTYRYYLPPTLTSMLPLVGPTFGGTALTLTGTGFAVGTPGPNAVDVGGAPATNVVTLADTTITCTAPAGVAGPADVRVTNLNGTVTIIGMYLYYVPILAAEGGGNPPPLQHSLFAVDPATGLVQHIGSIGFGVTGMDFGPGGVLYGTTAPGTPGAARDLITINPATGAGTLVGPTTDGGGINHVIPDCSFFLGALYGTDGAAGNLVSINVTTGQVAVAGPTPPWVPGGAFAVDAPNTATYFLQANGLPIFSVNIPTAFFTPGPPTVGILGPIGRFTAACYHNGTLYAVEAAPGPGPRHLEIINAATGVATPVGPPLPALVSAIASPTR